MLIEKLLLSKNPQRPGSMASARQALTWCDCQRHGDKIDAFLSAWFTFTFILPALSSPGSLFFFLNLYSLVVLLPINLPSQRQQEEFNLCLPPSHADVFASRAQVLLFAPITFVILTPLVYALQLPSIFWGIWCADLLNQPSPPQQCLLLLNVGLLSLIPMLMLFRQSFSASLLFSRSGMINCSFAAFRYALIVFIADHFHPLLLTAVALAICGWILLRTRHEFRRRFLQETF
ncbi:MAG: hypothetical protein RL095_3810 [Verrucomicrobiota bacterium]|jgi:hypothetical protein